jgi:hypothetical protein
MVCSRVPDTGFDSVSCFSLTSTPSRAGQERTVAPDASSMSTSSAVRSACSHSGVSSSYPSSSTGTTCTLKSLVPRAAEN